MGMCAYLGYISICVYGSCSFYPFKFGAWVLTQEWVLAWDTTQGFIWAKIFEGETEGGVGLMGRLGEPRGWVWEGENLSISYYQSSQKAT